MSQRNEASLLRDHGINPSAQRVAVAQNTLHKDEHPSADEVLTRVHKRFPHVSRATVYNTLNLFVEVGLLRQFVLTEDLVVFDPRTEDHHHFVEEESGKIYDVPSEAVKVSRVPKIDGFEIREYQVVMPGTRKRRKRRS